MKRKHLKIAITVFAVLFIVLMGWRIWPCSFSDIISEDKSSIIYCTTAARIGGIKDGEPVSDSYSMNNHETDENLKGLLEILDSSAYQPDFRNLLPGSISSVEADKNYDDRNAIVVLGWGNSKEEYVEIQFLSSSIIAVKREGDPGFMIYHPTDRNLLDSLIAYIQENGDKS